MTAQTFGFQSRFTSLKNLRLDHPNWQNPRLLTGLDTKSLADLAADFKGRGIQEPLKILRVLLGEEEYELVLNGQRRFTAAGLAYEQDDEIIPVIDVTPTEEAVELTPDMADELLLDELSAGTRREGLSSYELAQVAIRLRSRNRTMESIAEAIGRSESWVSKMLKACGKADPKLITSWKKGDVTDEQFKDLAMVQVEEQKEALDDVLDTKASGDKAEARVKAKEKAAKAKIVEKKAKAVAKAAKAEKKTDKKAAKKAKGQKQLDLAQTKKVEVEPQEPPKRVAKPLGRHILEEFIAIGEKKPPTSEYVIGLMDGVKHALGLLDVTEMAKPWQTYIARVGGVSIGEQRKAKNTKDKKPKMKAAGKKTREAAPERTKKAKKSKAKAKK